MANRNDGIYTLNEFKNKGVLKLAPDFFVQIQGRDDARVLVSNETKSAEYTVVDGNKQYTGGAQGNNDAGFQKISFKSGITNMSVGFATNPGSGTCSLTYVCPQYHSLNQSFYIDQPNGTKVPFFSSMMEVQVFAKGRFMRKDGEDLVPAYYPVFWGFITTVNESYNSSETTFNITCRDMLGWWEYQNVNVVASPVNARYGGGSVPSTGSLFRFMNPWEIMLNLFQETTFDNFVFPALLKNGVIPPEAAMPRAAKSEPGSDGIWEILGKQVLASWKGRYGMGTPYSSKNKKDSAFSNLEMFGISKVFRLEDLASTPFKVDSDESLKKRKSPLLPDTEPGGNQTPNADGSTDGSSTPKNSGGNGGNRVYQVKKFQTPSHRIDVDFAAFGRVLPFGAFSSYSMGTEPTKMTKLEVASYVADSIHFEFYQDVNGMFVFKPPFFNMDTSNNPIYVIKAGDIINADFAEDSSQIVTFVEASGPIIMQATSTDFQAAHADFGLMAKYGIRERTVKVAYGNNAEELQAMAAGEMAKANSKAYTANVTIPFRPEIRIGYPVYIDHLDTFYYLRSVSHSISMGNTATTTLVLEAKRVRLYNAQGEPLRGYIQKSFATAESKKLGDKGERAVQLDTFKKNLSNDDALRYQNSQSLLSSQQLQKEAEDSTQNTTDNSYFEQAMTPSEQYYQQGGFISSPTPGFYRIVESDAFKAFRVVTSDTAKSQSNGDPTKTRDFSVDVANGELTELVHYTGETLPYTDVNGFYHIGGFPYGANMVLRSDGNLQSTQDFYGNSMAFKAEQLDQEGKSGDVKNISADPQEGLSTTDDAHSIHNPRVVSSDVGSSVQSKGKSERDMVANVASTNNPKAAFNQNLNNQGMDPDAIANLNQSVNQ